LRQVIVVQRSLDDTDYLMDKLGVVGMNDRWVRALKKQLTRGLPQPGYRLGPFYAEDLGVLDSYIYRMQPQADVVVNGTTPKSRKSSNGAAPKRKARTAARA
jgi:hypothetical protein